MISRADPDTAATEAAGQPRVMMVLFRQMAQTRTAASARDRVEGCARTTAAIAEKVRVETPIITRQIWRKNRALGWR